MGTAMRLQKYLASCGIASRRKCETFILEGKVKVNGHTVQELGVQVEPTDEVWFDNQRVKMEEETVYYMLNKPVGYVTTVKDERGRATVMDLLQDVSFRIFPIGRLDYQTSGLLLLTNDGSLTYGLTHPKHDVNKTYEVKVKGQLSKQAEERLRAGVLIDGRKTCPAEVSKLKRGERTTRFNLTIHEGRNRQVRKMCEAVGYPVLALHRASIGRLKLGNLEEGKYRKLTDDEVIYLKQIIIKS